MLAARKWLSRSDDIIDITPSQCRDRTSPDSMILMVSILSGTAYGIVFVICGFVLIMNFSSALRCGSSEPSLHFVTQRQDVILGVFIEENINNRISAMLYVLYVITNWSVYGLLILLYFQTSTRVVYVTRDPLPFLTTGSLALCELASPGITQDTIKLTNRLIIYRTVSLSLCIVLTSLIVGHLLTIYRKMMLIKSAMLEIVSPLVYVIAIGLGSPLQTAFLPILGQVQVIAPMLIIYRVVRRAWGTATELSKHYDLTKPKLGLQINTAGCYGLEFSAPPTLNQRAGRPVLPTSIRSGPVQ